MCSSYLLRLNNAKVAGAALFARNDLQFIKISRVPRDAPCIIFIYMSKCQQVMAHIVHVTTQEVSIVWTSIDNWARVKTGWTRQTGFGFSLPCPDVNRTLQTLHCVATRNDRWSKTPIRSRLRENWKLIPQRKHLKCPPRFLFSFH